MLCRSHGVDGFPGTATVEQCLWQLAEALLPARADDCSRYIQAQMDLGATLCTRAKPACADCPLNDICVARRDGRVNELPQPRPRKSLPQRSLRVLLLHDGERWLFERRPPHGIWGGLLSLPEVAADEDVQQKLHALACAAADLQALAPLRHSFTHFHLTLQPLLAAVEPLPQVAESGRYRWLTSAELSTAALPTPIRKILQTALATVTQGRG